MIRAATAAITVALAAHASAFAGSCGDFPPAGFDDAGQSAWTGRYVNETYAYAASIPAPLVGHSAPSPAPQHGFGIVLAWSPRAYVFVDGSWSLLDDPSTRAAADQRLGWRRQDAARWLSTRRSSARLGGLPAVRDVSRFRCPGLDGVYVTEDLTAIDRTAGIVYTVSLDTRADRYARDRVTFERLVASFVRR